MEIFFNCDKNSLEIQFSRELCGCNLSRKVCGSDCDILRLENAVKKYQYYQLEIFFFVRKSNSRWLNAASKRVLKIFKRLENVTIFDLKISVYTPGEAYGSLSYKIKTFRWNSSVSTLQRNNSKEWLNTYYNNLLAAIPLQRDGTLRPYFCYSTNCGDMPPELQLPPLQLKLQSQSPTMEGRSHGRSLFRNDRSSTIKNSGLRQSSILRQVACINDPINSTPNCVLI